MDKIPVTHASFSPALAAMRWGAASLLLLIATVLVASPAFAQPLLSLPEAIARAGTQPRRRIGGGGGARSSRTRHTGSRRLFAKGRRRGILAARQQTGVRVQLASCAASVHCGRASPSLRSITQMPPTTSARPVRRAVAVRSQPSRRMPGRIDRAGHGRDRKATRRPRPDRGSRLTRLAVSSSLPRRSGRQRRRSKPRGPIANWRQPPRRRPGDRRGRPAAGRLPGTHARTDTCRRFRMNALRAPG